MPNVRTPFTREELPPIEFDVGSDPLPTPEVVELSREEFHLELLEEIKQHDDIFDWLSNH